MKRRYTIVIESAGANVSAHAPDVPGCIATGATIEETLQEMRGALVFHFQGLTAEGKPVPEPTSQVAYVEVDEPAGVPAR